MKNYILTIIILAGMMLSATELNLETAWQKVLANNSQLQSQQLTMKSRIADVKLSLYDLLPSGSISGSYNRSGKNDLDEDSMGWRMSLSQSLFQGGKLTGNLKNSVKVLLQSMENVKELRLDLRMQLESKYYNVLKLQENLQTARQQQGFLNTNLATAQVRFDNGSLSRSDLLQLRSQKAQQDVTILRAENSLQMALNDLENFLGLREEIELSAIDLGPYENIITDLENWQIADINAKQTELIKVALEKNPSIQVNKLSVDISEVGVKTAKGNFLPSFSMSLSKSWNYQYFSDDPEGSLSLGLSASLPFFPIGDKVENYTKSRYALKQSELSLQQNQLDLENSLKSSLLNLVAGVQEIRAAAMARDYAQESYLQAEESFANRIITANELLNTQIALTTAENAVTSARYDFLGYKGELQKSLGIASEEDLWDLLLNSEE
ncbi:MAG: TolC family protein [Candidatus Cloacimonetes bacterium]|nr:TolC family protein [Candidatus Cloacimonadota bacterium]